MDFILPLFITYCSYLISCVDEGSQKLISPPKCPKYCSCYNAPPPFAFNDDHQYRNDSSKLI